MDDNLFHQYDDVVSSPFFCPYPKMVSVGNYHCNQALYGVLLIYQSWFGRVPDGISNQRHEPNLLHGEVPSDDII